MMVVTHPEEHWVSRPRSGGGRRSVLSALSGRVGVLSLKNQARSQRPSHPSGTGGRPTLPAPLQLHPGVLTLPFGPLGPFCLFSEGDRFLATDSTGHLGCPWVWWKFICSHRCYFEIWLFRELHRTWEKKLQSVGSQVEDFHQCEHVLLCFKVQEFRSFLPGSISYGHHCVCVFLGEGIYYCSD